MRSVSNSKRASPSPPAGRETIERRSSRVRSATAGRADCARRRPPPSDAERSGPPPRRSRSCRCRGPAPLVDAHARDGLAPAPAPAQAGLRRGSRHLPSATVAVAMLPQTDHLLESRPLNLHRLVGLAQCSWDFGGVPASGLLARSVRWGARRVRPPWTGGRAPPRPLR